MSDLESVVSYLSRPQSRKSVLTKLSPRLLSKLLKEIEDELKARDKAKEASRLLKKQLLQRAEKLGIPYERLKEKLEKERKPARKITYEINGQIVRWSGRGHAPKLLQPIIDTAGKEALKGYIQSTPQE
ncbi:hypothetical protein KAM448_40590 [Aeromonas caviae]|uniref:H-NS histone family protein n=1 Tax=Aeromonas caviae TaxID=648 RepID=A0ABD0BC81_AERCA|nr:H-NS family nucleoid-associated regulatory protein [Aeromonas caviae]GJA83755.1 hypothetical protein KAM355_43150 [Aeromonas caviae]GJB13329.1 hypothetical protein KAM362_38890 [Aeromonas caviae]GJB26557.1 hypothetical protein KAM365_43070 [Aeromonas caviae]GJB35199.1 hypothetical protein KAM367_43010 [Aeromonas caviae]GJB43583.1 hypothetical protein KAM369_40580 [Aeromonas caviae]